MPETLDPNQIASARVLHCPQCGGYVAREPILGAVRMRTIRASCTDPECNWRQIVEALPVGERGPARTITLPDPNRKTELTAEEAALATVKREAAQRRPPRIPSSTLRRWSWAKPMDPSTRDSIPIKEHPMPDNSPASLSDLNRSQKVRFAWCKKLTPELTVAQFIDAGCPSGTEWRKRKNIAPIKREQSKRSPKPAPADHNRSDDTAPHGNARKAEPNILRLLPDESATPTSTPPAAPTPSRVRILAIDAELDSTAITALAEQLKHLFGR